jgi:tRNA modification GTPase
VGRSVAPFLPAEISLRHAYYGSFSGGDDGLAVVFGTGHSFTGELVVELNCHGSPLIVADLLERCYAAGARPAQAGEFSLRAFLNGQIDLAQAEGIRETVDAMSQRQLQRGHALRSGFLGRELAPILEDLRFTLTTVEALTDFSEELGELDDEIRLGRLNAAISRTENFLSTRDAARMLREGAVVALAGLPNAGKSSLLNALLKADRAIVSTIPGTTRDTLEESIGVKGVPVRLVDTAGLRDTGDEIEQMGISRTRRVLESCDGVLYVFDSSLGWSELDEAEYAPYADKSVIVASKCDLGPSDRGIGCSVVTGEGLGAVVDAIAGFATNSDIEPLTLVDRHYEVMADVLALLGESRQVLENSAIPDDLAAVTLRSALRKLGELTGESAPADVLEQIFSQFCIGK